MFGDERPLPPGRVVSARQFLGVVLVLSVALTAFLWKPIAHGRYFDPSGLLQQSRLFHVDGGASKPANPILGDPVGQMRPWLRWNRVQLGHLKLPLWNPYNGGGTPHLANFQSAVFSPFSVPFYVLPYRLAGIASAFLKLFALGLFTYLFLRRVNVSHLGAIVGGVAFTYGSYNVLWVSWPHPGAAIGLPAGLYFAEVALHSAHRRRAMAAWGGFSLALACGVLVGHPETFFFTTLVAAVYVAGRVLFRGAPLRDKVRDGLIAVGGAALALGVGAVQILPFLEYLNISTAKAIRGGQYLRHWNTHLGILQIFPDLFGRPDQAFYDPSHYLNYQDASAVSTGLVVLFLAGLAVVSMVRRRSFAGVFFSATAAAWVIYAYDLGGLGHLVGSLPWLRTAYPGLSASVWLFATSVLAAIGVDVLLSVGSSAARDRRPVAIAVLAAGMTVAAGTAVLGRLVLDHLGSRPGTALATAAGRAASDHHVRFIVLTLLVAVLAMAAMVAMSGRSWIRLASWVVLLLTVFIESGFRLRNYNTTEDGRFVYPVTASVTALKSAVGSDRTLLWGLAPPDINLWYQVASPDTYDAVGVSDYDNLYNDLIRMTDARLYNRLFNVLGIRWVASTFVNPFPRVVTDTRLFSDSASATADIPLSAAQPVAQVFSTIADGMNTVIVAAHPVPGETACRVDLSLVDVASGVQVRTASAPCVDGSASLAIAPLAGGASRYRAEFRGVGRLALAPAAVEGGALDAGGSPVTGHVVVLGYAALVPELEAVGDINAPVKLFRVNGSPALFSSPPEARAVPTQAAAVQAVQAPGYDTNKTVVIEGNGGSSSGGPGAVEVLKQEPTDIHLRVHRDDPGWLLALQSYYPGWKASVNGRSVRISRANAAFSAVPVGAGTSDVVLSYRPASVRRGLAVSVLSALAILALLAQAFVPRPRRKAGASDIQAGGGRPGAGRPQG